MNKNYKGIINEIGFADKIFILFILFLIIIVSGCTSISNNKYKKGDILNFDDQKITGNYALYVDDYNPNSEIYVLKFITQKDNKWNIIGLMGDLEVKKEQLEVETVSKLAHSDNDLPIDNSDEVFLGAFDLSKYGYQETPNSITTTTTKTVAPTKTKTTVPTVKSTIASTKTPLIKVEYGKFISPRDVVDIVVVFDKTFKLKEKTVYRTVLNDYIQFGIFTDKTKWYKFEFDTQGDAELKILSINAKQLSSSEVEEKFISRASGDTYHAPVKLTEKKVFTNQGIYFINFGDLEGAKHVIEMDNRMFDYYSRDYVNIHIKLTEVEFI